MQLKKDDGRLTESKLIFLNVVSSKHGLNVPAFPQIPPPALPNGQGTFSYSWHLLVFLSIHHLVLFALQLGLLSHSL